MTHKPNIPISVDMDWFFHFCVLIKKKHFEFWNSDVKFVFSDPKNFEHTKFYKNSLKVVEVIAKCTYIHIYRVATSGLQNRPWVRKRQTYTKSYCCYTRTHSSILLPTRGDDHSIYDWNITTFGRHLPMNRLKSSFLNIWAKGDATSFFDML